MRPRTLRTLSLALLAVAASAARGQIYNWNTNNAGFWDDGANWAGGRAPGTSVPTQEVVIELLGKKLFTTTLRHNVTLAKLTSQQTLAQTAGTLTLTGASTIDRDYLLSGGSLVNTGSAGLDVARTFDWSGGSVQTAALGMNVGRLNIRGTGTLVGRLVNRGQATVDGTQGFGTTSGGSATLANLSTGTMTATGLLTRLTLENSGTLNYTPGANPKGAAMATVLNSGTLNLDGGGFAGTGSVTNKANAILNAQGALTGVNIANAGTMTYLVGNGTGAFANLTNTGVLTLDGTGYRGRGSFSNPSGATAIVTGLFTGTTLANAGTMTYTPGVGAEDFANLTNTGVLTLDGTGYNGSGFFSNPAGAVAMVKGLLSNTSLVNAGTMIYTPGTGATATNQALLRNTGNLTINGQVLGNVRNTGTLAIGPGSFTRFVDITGLDNEGGTLVPNGGTTLYIGGSSTTLKRLGTINTDFLGWGIAETDLQGGTLDLAKFGTDGNRRLQGSTVAFKNGTIGSFLWDGGFASSLLLDGITLEGNGRVFIPSLNLANGLTVRNGTLVTDNAVNVQGTQTVSGGLLGSTLNVPTSAKLTLEGGEVTFNKANVQGELVNGGTLRVSGTSGLNLSPAGRFTNASGGTFVFDLPLTLDTNATILNEGTMTTVPGFTAGFGNVGAGGFLNRGTIQPGNLGTLTLSGTLTNAGTIRASGLQGNTRTTVELSGKVTNGLGGTIEAVDGGAVAINYGGDNRLLNAGTLRASGAGSAFVTYGTVRIEDLDAQRVENGARRVLGGRLSGTLDNSGKTFDFNRWAPGTFDMARNGTLVGGNVVNLPTPYQLTPRTTLNFRDVTFLKDEKLYNASDLGNTGLANRLGGTIRTAPGATLDLQGNYLVFEDGLRLDGNFKGGNVYDQNPNASKITFAKGSKTQITQLNSDKSRATGYSEAIIEGDLRANVISNSYTYGQGVYQYRVKEGGSFYARQLIGETEVYGDGGTVYASDMSFFYTGGGLFMNSGLVTMAMPDVQRTRGNALDIGPNSFVLGKDATLQLQIFGRPLPNLTSADFVYMFYGPSSVDLAGTLQLDVMTNTLVAGDTFRIIVGDYGRGKVTGQFSGFQSNGLFDLVYGANYVDAVYRGQPVPEPAAFAALAVGLLGVLRRRRK